MKKIVYILIITAVSLPTIAQSSNSLDIANHLSVSASAGTTGLGFEVAFPITSYLNVRAGYEKMPQISKNSMISYLFNNESLKTEIEGTFNLDGWKILLDIYPSKHYTFHITMGLFSGETNIITAKNITPLNNLVKSLSIGGYNVAVEDGYASLAIKTNKTKPYLGIGFGRAVPKKHIGVAIDLGVLFWGKPVVYENYSGQNLPVDISKLGGNKNSEYIEKMSKIKVWPVFSIRFIGRIF